MNDEMKEILNDFLAESSEMLEALDQHFVKLETEPSNTELLNEIFRCMHSMKGSAGFLGFTHLVEVAHQAESLLNKLRQGEMTVSPFIIDIILEAVDAVKMLQTDIRETGGDSHVETQGIVNKLALTMDSADDLMLTVSPPKKAGIETISVAHSSPPAEMTASSMAEPPDTSSLASPYEEPSLEGPVEVEGVPEPAAVSEGPVGLSDVLHKMKEATTRTVQAASAPGSKLSGGKEEDQTVRVETKRLDHVMNLVGELVLNRNRLMKLGNGLEEQDEINPALRELNMTLAQLNLVTSDLQLAVMKTRMVPIRKVFSRFPRLVRDLAGKLGKQVRLELVGEDTEVDKSVADELSDPLVHLVRNSMDHGLETAADRKQHGKSPEGYVRLSAQQEGNSIVIRIEDNGRGLQIEKIAAKALEKGLVAQSELDSMSPREIMNLIFLPGFSTADQVSDVSGRGVGMDVVRTNISRMNGSLELDSDPGQGSRVTIKLPLTVAIIQALMVEVECATFAIPLASVVEAVKVTKDEIKSVNRQAVLNLRERILPLLDLGETFHIPRDRTDEECYVVVVKIGEQQFGVVVNRLRAQEEVVIKSLGEFLANVKCVAGATITGDGKVVLILDMADLVREVQASTYTGMR
ncbi:chemotaxis protein CheA [Candidatus Nitrospira neomarina]|uniref:histidine kinase n=1 Tax=Candidatus Nitrospira neomarina TaxID=3020899 RepID=A0AA96GI38_9BACT|nr:chemotaxis protein CheA [Candidatus Nitrospira neomarina]WNM62799.1 chemotaxis protein CheA [Candidatus Nitrospira neomarina]